MLRVASKTYSQKLSDHRWLRKKADLIQDLDGRCQDCGETKPLTVHHRFYKHDTDPWDYPDYCFHVICWECHKQAQVVMEGCHEMVAKHDLEHELSLLDRLSWDDREVFKAFMSYLPDVMNGNQTAHTDKVRRVMQFMQSELNIQLPP